ncbi:MAG: hypothetical protein ACREUF_09730, partial [Solimonas sp.]
MHGDEHLGPVPHSSGNRLPPCDCRPIPAGPIVNPYHPDRGQGMNIGELDWHGLSRRRFLKLALATSGTLGLAGVGATLSGCTKQTAIGADGRPYLFLDDDMARAFAVFGEAVIPHQPGFPTLAETGVLRRMDEEVSFVGQSIRDDLRSALGLLEITPFLYGRFSRFSRLDIAGRQRIIKALLTSRVETFRAVGSNLKFLVHFFYFGHRATWK